MLLLRGSSRTGFGEKKVTAHVMHISERKRERESKRERERETESDRTHVGFAAARSFRLSKS